MGRAGCPAYSSHISLLNNTRPICITTRAVVKLSFGEAGIAGRDARPTRREGFTCTPRSLGIRECRDLLLREFQFPKQQGLQGGGRERINSTTLFLPFGGTTRQSRRAATIGGLPGPPYGGLAMTLSLSCPKGCVFSDLQSVAGQDARPTRKGAREGQLDHPLLFPLPSRERRPPLASPGCTHIPQGRGKGR